MLEFLYTHIYLIGLVSLAITALAMPVVLRIAKEKHFVVRPNKRTCHEGEIPNVGGLGICFAFLITYLLFCFDTLQESQFLLIGAFLIVMVGFVDDVLVLTPLTKLICEVFIGILLISFADIRITHLHGIFGLTNQIGLVPSYLLSFFVFIAIVNAINLIDGVDGLASGLGILSCSFFAVWFDWAGENDWAILAVSIIGSLMVYFVYNVFGKRNKIFMGDSGSLLLGYLLTAFVFRFLECNAYNTIPVSLHMSAAPAVAICILGVPLFDTVRVSLTRIKHGKSPFQPDKNHIHHLLLRTGLTHLQTTLVLMGVSMFSILLGIVGRNWNFWLLLGTETGLLTILTFILWRILDRQHDKH